MFRYLSIFGQKVIFHHALEAANPWAERGTAPARKIFQAVTLLLLKCFFLTQFQIVKCLDLVDVVNPI